MKTQTQNPPKKIWAVSVLVCRFWAVFWAILVMPASLGQGEQEEAQCSRRTLRCMCHNKYIKQIGSAKKGYLQHSL